MPEGDTLRRAELDLQPVLEGQVLTEAWFRKLRGHRPRIGDRVRGVDAVGKHLLIEFERPLVLRTHLGMAGSWRTQRLDRPVPSSPRLRIVLETAAGRALCFSAPLIETYVRGVDDPLADLGPDLSDDDCDLTAVFGRARVMGAGHTLAEALLDQRIAAGVGNVFKSEAAFVARLDPFADVSDLSDDDIERVWTIAHRMLVGNRGRRTRVTTPMGTPGRTYVYGRFRAECRVCHNSVMYSAAGERTSRSTYWCPSCQPSQPPG